MITACTIIAGNYLAHARVLAESFFTHHPDGSFTVLVVEGVTTTYADPAQNEPSESSASATTFWLPASRMRETISARPARGPR